MKSRFIYAVAFTLASVGIACPQVAYASNPAAAAARPAVADVALQAGNLLAGQVVDPQGAPLAGVPVTVSQHGQTVATATTTPEGVFAVHDLKGGVYQVEAAGAEGVYRVWAERTAPPAANQAILLVGGDDTVRGQGRVLNTLSNPWVVAAIVATAIAVPLALDKKKGS